MSGQRGRGAAGAGAADERLRAFLTELAGRPLTHGDVDCVTAPAAWVALCCGVDPAAAFRGAYSTAEECAALVRRGGHLPRLVAREMRRHGFARTAEPQPGDVAVIRLPDVWAGAIRAPRGFWAVKRGDGLTMTKRARLVAAWRV